EVHGGVGLDALGLVAGLAELPGQRHREAAGVCGGDQVLWGGGVGLLEARLERIRALVGPAAHPHRAAALGERAVPDGARGPVRHLCLLSRSRCRPKHGAQCHPVDDPLTLFRSWLEEARTAMGYDAEAMALATATPDGAPSARTVRPKGVGRGGLALL